MPDLSVITYDLFTIGCYSVSRDPSDGLYCVWLGDTFICDRATFEHAREAASAKWSEYEQFYLSSAD